MSVKLHREVGLVGFICPMHQQGVTIDEHCVKCCTPCRDLDELLAMFSPRAIVPKKYRTTEILNPRQIIYFSRNFPYYLSPDSMSGAAIGTAWHEARERQVRKHRDRYFKHITIEEENEFVKDFGFCTLGGKPDKFDHEIRKLTDIKTAKAYSVNKFLHDHWKDSTWHSYQQQTNIYRIYKFPNTKTIELDVTVVGWDRYVNNVGINDKLRQIVPFLDDDKLDEWVRNRLEDIMEDQETGNPPPCPEEDMWINKNGEPQRCLRFCGGKAYCQQFIDWEKSRR